MDPEELFRGINPQVLRDLWELRWGKGGIDLYVLTEAAGPVPHYWYKMSQVLRAAGWMYRTSGQHNIAYQLKEGQRDT
jgi:hypothetical protein